MTNPDVQKALLFCPSCWHESPPDGDWQRERREDGVALVCPNCESTVTVRPAADTHLAAVAK